MPSDDSPERRPSFSKASSDDDTEIYVRKEAAPPAPKHAPTPVPVAATVEDPITVGGEAVKVTEPARPANPDQGPFATFVNVPSKTKPDTPASRPLPASTDDVEVYVGRQPKPEERIASTAETGQFLIAPSQDGDGTYVYPTKAKPKEAKAAPTTNDPHLKSTVDAIHRHQSTAETGAFLIPPNGGGGGSGDSFYEYPTKPKEKTPDSLAKTMVYRGPMSSDGSILYEGKPREVPRHDLERAKPTEASSDGTELYVGHKPTRSVQPTPHENFVLYGGKVEAAKPGIKPGPPTEGPNATKYYANPNTAPGNKMVERTSQFDLYESTPKPKEERAPQAAPSWQDGNAVLYTSKNASQRPPDMYPSLVNLKPDRGYDRSVSDSNGFILYEKPKAPREARAPGPVGASDPSNGYIYYEKAKRAPVAPVPTSEPVAASASYELYEEKKPSPAPFEAPVAPEPVELPAAVPTEEPAHAKEEEDSLAPSASSLGVEDADFEVFERAPPPEPAAVAAATLDVVDHVPAPVVEPVPPEPVVEAALDLPLAAAEPVAETPPAPVVEQVEVVEAEPIAPMFDPLMAEAFLAPTEPTALAIPLAPPAVVVPEEPEPVMIDIIESAEVPPIEPEAANVDPTPAITDLPGESKLEGIDVLEAPLAPLPLEFALGNMPSFPRFETLPTELPGIESRHGPAVAPTSPETGLDREAPTPEYVPKEFTLEASARGSVDMRIGFVVSEFNYDITSMMLERAKAHAEFLGAKLGPILHVPGTFDMGLAVKKLLGRKDVDGVVTLGAVIQGETDHDQLVLQHASRKIADLSIESGKPVALGITGPGMTRLQAMERIDRAKDAVEAVVKLHGRLKAIEN